MPNYNHPGCPGFVFHNREKPGRTGGTKPENDPGFNPLLGIPFRVSQTGKTGGFGSVAKLAKNQNRETGGIAALPTP
jgi:hypothetical protein